MSYQFLKEDVLFYQRFLKANGFYPHRLDGSWGPKTNAADIAFLQQSEATDMCQGSECRQADMDMAYTSNTLRLVLLLFMVIWNHFHQE